MRTPLTSISGFTDLAFRNVKKRLAAVEELAAAGTVEEMDVTRFDKGRFHVECTAMDLKGLARRVASRMELTSEKHLVRGE